MGKRDYPNNFEADHGSQPKKQKLQNESANERFNVNDFNVNDFTDGSQLRQLFAFQQEDFSSLSRNVQLFKSFLDSITSDKEDTDRAEKLKILVDFLRLTVSTQNSTDVALPDLIQTWSFAASTNNDNLLSAVPALLALLLKTISHSIEFQDYAVQICRTLLQKDQIKLFDRGLTANKTKERLISPCLRLLTEIVCVDGGGLAKNLYLERDITFKRLDIFLRMRNQSSSHSSKNLFKPTVRTNAVRYLMKNLQLQGRDAKSDILSQMKLTRALVEDLNDDPYDMVLEILNTIKTSVALDPTQTRRTKSKFFTDWTLSRISLLYDYPLVESSPEGHIAMPSIVHTFLIFICTTLDLGVLSAQHGWYPPGAESVKVEADVSLNIEQQTGQTKSIERVSVRNITLAAFLQGLRPHASVYHKELSLAIFTAAPELVADYFYKKKLFTFEPKLSATWIGYAAFLFSAIQLPTPHWPQSDDYRRPKPPLISTVLESILPYPLSQKTLTKCLNQNVQLITFLAVRLLLMGFHKLENVLEDFKTIVQNRSWQEGVQNLRSRFLQRCPELRTVISAFRRCSSEQTLLRESLTRLLSLYYKTAPELALDEKFDISIVLANTLGSSVFERRDDRKVNLRRLDLDHLLDIASRSPDMRWWHKPDEMNFTPFTTILQLYVDSQGINLKSIRQLLQSVMDEYGVLQKTSSNSSLDALTTSLRKFGGWQASNTLYGFLDNCLLRFVRKPTKYFGDLAEITGNSYHKSTQGMRRNLSLLLLVILEQWPFFVHDRTDEEVSTGSEWVSRYLELSRLNGEDSELLTTVQAQLHARTKSEHCKTLLKSISDSLDTAGLEAELLETLKVKDMEAKPLKPSHAADQRSDSGLELLVVKPPIEASDYPGLTKWSKKDVQDTIQGNYIGDLILCLSSAHEEIRLQAVANLRIFTSRLEMSGYPEWQQVHLLLGELVESARSIIPNEPFPSFASVFTATCLLVLTEPLHFMFAKVNKFLNKGPEWNVKKLPSHWIEKILLHPPVEDEAHHREVGWVLDILIDGLRTPHDMEHYRRSNVFERILSLSASPSIHKSGMDKILQLLYRCTFVNGSTTLITRCGILSWVQGRLAIGGPHHAWFRALAAQISQTCDRDRVMEWSDGTAVLVEGEGPRIETVKIP